MALGEINLKCSDFLTNVFNSFSQLKSSDIFTDVTLVSDDNKQIQAHKIILSAGSEYFRDILSDKSHPHPMLCLDNVGSEDLAWIIQYLYVGEVSVPQSSLPKFLKVANKLKCVGLNEKILPNLSQKWGSGTLVSSESTTKFDENQAQVTEEVGPEEELNSLPKFDEIQAQDNEEIEEPLFINLKDYEYVEATDKYNKSEINSSLSDDESITEDSWKTLISNQDPGATNKSMKEISQFDKAQVQDAEEIEEPLFIKDVEHREAIDNNSDLDNKIRISTEAMTETVLNTKELKSLPDFCRIEGKIFSMSQLKQFLKEIYHRNEDGIFSCNYCAIIQKSSGSIMEHVQTHVENLEFDCDRCGKIFKKTHSLRAHKNGKKCDQRQLINPDESWKTQTSNHDPDATKKEKKDKAWEIKNIVAQTIASMEKSKKTWKRLRFTQNVLEPLLKARKIRIKGSTDKSKKYLADRYQRKIKRMREEIRDSQEIFPGEKDKHLVSESWGFKDLRVEISQGLLQIEILDKRNKKETNYGYRTDAFEIN